MKLYYAPNTRALRPRWLLEEAGLPYELVRVDMQAGQHRSAAYKAVHPLGAVPALEDGEVTLIESSAICMYLADKLPPGQMAPAPGTQDRGRYYQWMVYAVATLEGPNLEFLRARQADDEKGKQAARARAIELARPIAAALEGRSYLVGDHFSAADVMIGSVLGWGLRLGALDLETLPTLQAYLQRLTDRPAFKLARS
jgi:glutathione S-transferase